MNHVYTKLSTIRDIGVVKSPFTRRLGIVISLCFLSSYLVIIFQTKLVQNKGITDGEETGFILGTIHESLKKNYVHFNAQLSNNHFFPFFTQVVYIRGAMCAIAPSNFKEDTVRTH